MRQSVKFLVSNQFISQLLLNFFFLAVVDIFRPFKGYKSVRLIPREIGPNEKVILCFADFENAFQTTLVINTLQGYRFDKDDIWGLQFSYANKQANSMNSQGGKNEGGKEVNPNNNNNNSNANQSARSADASSASKDGAGVAGSKPGNSSEAFTGAQGNNNSSKK